MSVLAERLLAPVRDAGVDALLLGCTHYPFLARTIADVMGRDVVLVSSADETAFEVRDVLVTAGIGRSVGPDRPGSFRVFSSGDVEWFASVGGRLFGGELGPVQGLTWTAPEPAPPDADRAGEDPDASPGAASV